MKNEVVTCITLLICSVFLGCVQKMATEGRVQPLSRVSRMPPPGTVPRNISLETDARPELSLTLLKHGRERYEISCAPCHGFSGHGDGMVVQRGLLPPPSYHSERLRKASDDHYLDVIKNGYGAMYSYADRVTPRDRVAIVAYIRALQLSQNVELRSLPKQDQREVR